MGNRAKLGGSFIGTGIGDQRRIEGCNLQRGSSDSFYEERIEGFGEYLSEGRGRGW